MPDELRLWLRHETRSTERRAPIVPADAARLVRAGASVTVEESPQRVFDVAEYAAAGCAVSAPGGWVDAPGDTYVVGLKELPSDSAALRHRHVFFAHAYKGQRGSAELLRRFAAGGGAILDLEYLTDPGGRRLVAFGYWAGYLGAALAVLHRHDSLATSLRPWSRDQLDRELADTRRHRTTSVLVIGALGRCGTGAAAALAAAGIEPTRWDLAETRDLDRPALLGHDLLINAVLTDRPAPPFLTDDDLVRPRRLAVVADVTCDVGSPHHLLPIYRQTTTWDAPVLSLPDADPPLDVISLDNLPSLLPLDASAAFSADLLPHLLSLPDKESPWRRCLDRYRQARDHLDTETEPVHA